MGRILDLYYKVWLTVTTRTGSEKEEKAVEKAISKAIFTPSSPFSSFTSFPEEQQGRKLTYMLNANVGAISPKQGKIVITKFMKRRIRFRISNVLIEHDPHERSQPKYIGVLKRELRALHR